MREAVGGTVVLNVALIFIVLINGYLAISVQYTKAFRVKNQIINIIEQYEGYTPAAQDVIGDFIWEARYHPGVNTVTCPDGSLPTPPGHLYCVERISAMTVGPNSGGNVYRVTTFLSLQLPFVGQLMETATGFNGIPIRGETKLVFSNTP